MLMAGDCVGETMISLSAAISPETCFLTGFADLRERCSWRGGASMCVPLGGFRAPNWDGVVGGIWAGATKAASGVQLAKGGRRGTADGAIIARGKGEE